MQLQSKYTNDWLKFIFENINLPDELYFIVHYKYLRNYYGRQIHQISEDNQQIDRFQSILKVCSAFIRKYELNYL